MTTNINPVATEDNYLQLLGAMNSFTALTLARDITVRLDELGIDGDGGYWLEKPHKFPEYWIPAINGTLDEDDLEIEL